MGSEYDIYKLVVLFNIFNNLRLLHHTATESNLHQRILFLVVLQIAKSAVHLVVGILTYGTGVVYNEIRMLISSFHVANLLKYSDKLF